MEYLDDCVAGCVYSAFAFEDILERKPVTMSFVARRAPATGFSSWVWDGAS